MKTSVLAKKRNIAAYTWDIKTGLSKTILYVRYVAKIIGKAILIKKNSEKYCCLSHRKEDFQEIFLWRFFSLFQKSSKKCKEAQLFSSLEMSYLYTKPKFMIPKNSLISNQYNILTSNRSTYRDVLVDWWSPFYLLLRPVALSILDVTVKIDVDSVRDRPLH